mmetsp:Transcript_8916/g.20836  ORF Transcript_8916/g.20836 Transcript_8916/m.20836 type:complete len:218 (-) Transcript_8916:678-1331(-)
MALVLYHSSLGLSMTCSLSEPSARGFSRCLSRASPTLGRLLRNTTILPPMWLWMRLAATRAGPSAQSSLRVDANIVGSASSNASTTWRQSVRLTSRSSGSGRNSSARSGTVSICGWLRLDFRLKKWTAESNARKPTCVRPPATPGNSSRHSLIVATAQFSIPELTAPALTSITKTYTGACGGRSMYSDGATSSTEPLHSSGRWALSRRCPSSSRWEK